MFDLTATSGALEAPTPPSAAPAPASAAPPAPPPGAAATLGLGCAIYFAASIVSFLVLIAAFVVLELRHPLFPTTSELLHLELTLDQAPAIVRHLLSLKSDWQGWMVALMTLAAAPAGIGLTVLAARRHSTSVRDELGLRLPSWRQALVWGGVVALYVVLEPALFRLLHLSSSSTQVLDLYRSALSLPLLYLALVVAAPAYEEILFRGFLLPGLRRSRLGAVGAVALTAAIWAGLHFLGTAGTLFIFILGVLLGAARLATGSTYLTMVLHGLLNLYIAVQAGFWLSHSGSGYYLAEARQNLQRKDYGKAIAAAREAEDFSPGTCFECTLLRSRALLAAGETAAAAERARELVRAHPPAAILAVAYDQLGVSLLAGGAQGPAALAEAEAAFRSEALLDRPDASTAYLHLADVLLRRGRRREAGSLAREALFKDPEGPNALTARVLNCWSRAAGPLPVPLPDPFAAQLPLPAARRTAPAQRASGADAGFAIELPELLYRLEPQTKAARRTPTGGMVFLESIVDQQGCVSSPRVIQGASPELDREALDLARLWTFLPASYQGRPVRVYFPVTVSFPDRDGRSESAERPDR